MADQAAAKKALQDLIKRDDLKNKTCIDCANPNPQWASLSFVRSVSMDTWQDEQIRRMQLGGNAPFRHFMQSYSPADQGGYTDGSSSYDTYHCWAATQYREKLDAELAGKPWTHSSPPPRVSSPASRTASPGRPSSAQGLRKSRTSTRTTGNTSPASFSPSGQSTPDLASTNQKTANEAYFASLGQANASRPADLPPSQGGRYQGFGSSPSPPPSSQHPSFGLTSAAAPSLSDFQENPTAALSKGWSLFSAAVAGASRAVSENVIQPGMERARDPSLHASVLGYVSEAQRRAEVVGRSANQWSKSQLGVDVADHVGGVVGTVKDKIGRGPQSAGYGAVGTEHEEESSALYHDDTDDFFSEYVDARHGNNGQQHSSQSVSHATTALKAPQAGAAKQDDWDEWKDF
ncbi:hypothetical protein SERLA73DRAFT_48352 [Serpula lacrymans var. lacrymans S7.3]|uniref:Arf-GAP domain-containing protein n=1 Tax=Serpula lacrymans var. lacrymans (strain S7.3) TaxID=936435 RepID=F8PPE0_SERL3|nr:hypothetical protein SERLA73DRAFT_48352 [Serpula lacrymans var. lacrymans S7.3]